MSSSLLDALGDGFRTVPELCRILGVSQPTVSRLLRAEADAVIRVGQARATRYARAAAVFGRERSYGIFRVDRHGDALEIGTLRALRDGRFLVQSDTREFWLGGERGDGLYPGLPYFLEDLRPGGFLGRSIARRLSALQGWPSDPQSWSGTVVGVWLLDFGEEAAGDLLIGSVARARATRHSGFTVHSRSNDYPRFAEQSLRDGNPGSSPGGEQPKFTAYGEEAGHVIVKFSPAGESPEAQRWRDLLHAEAAASAQLGACGLPAASATVHEFAGRVFLESRRFDRRGLAGRAPALSLEAVAAEFTGEIANWRRSAEALARRGVMDVADADRIVTLELFGAWIGNTDMHGANLSLRPAGAVFTLNPAYDMLPMAWAPLRGELPPVRYAPPAPERHDAARWRAMGEAAESYWSTLENNAAVSDSFRRIAAAVRAQVGRALAAV
jgi:hypothetical protein